MRNTNYHARFHVFNDQTNDHDDSDAIYEIWWREEILEDFENRMYQGECFDGACKYFILNIKENYWVNVSEICEESDSKNGGDESSKDTGQEEDQEDTDQEEDQAQEEEKDQEEEEEGEDAEPPDESHQEATEPSVSTKDEDDFDDDFADSDDDGGQELLNMSKKQN